MQALTSTEDEAIHYLWWDMDRAAPAEGVLASEVPLTIFVNGQELVTLLCTPSKANCLVTGFLYLEGVLHSLDEISLMRVCIEEGTADVRLTVQPDLPNAPRTLTSGCGGGVTFADFTNMPKVDSALFIRPRQLATLMRSLITARKDSKHIGGLHASALSDGQKLLMVAEDVGRHNTIDKIMGECLLTGISPRGHILLTTGRISSEMLVKAVKMGVPIVASRSSPTSLSTRLGTELNVTIVGYLRGERMNIYTNEWRIPVSA